MRIISLGLLALWASSAAIAGELAITITNVRKAEGTIVVTLNGSEAAWNGQAKSVEVRKVAAKSAADAKGNLTVRFADLPAGIYAVTVLHDENDNQKMDTGLMGIPSEPYGFSNNPRVMRKPYFSETKFEVGAEAQAIQIRLH